MPWEACIRPTCDPQPQPKLSPIRSTLDLREIKQIIELMKRHDLSTFHLERDGVKIKLKKGVDLDAVLETLRAQGGRESSPAAPEPKALPEPAAAAEPVSEVPTSEITAPTVGTFYRASAPGEAAFVKVGDLVEEDTVVCIIEAMKVMNEIKAEIRGAIKRVVAEDGNPVQYGDSLFEVDPA